MLGQIVHGHELLAAAVVKVQLTAVMVLSARSFAPIRRLCMSSRLRAPRSGEGGRPTSRVVIDARDGTASSGQRHVDRVGLDGLLKVAFTVVEVATRRSDAGACSMVGGVVSAGGADAVVKLQLTESMVLPAASVAPETVAV